MRQGDTHLQSSGPVEPSESCQRDTFQRGCFQIYGPTTRLSQESFPPYRHLPGITPHPVRDPQGHSYGVRESAPAAWEAGRWWMSEAYLLGIDFHNFAYYWEAHEAWEAIWKLARRQHDRLFLQGLIQVSAGLLKRELGNWKGLERLTRKGLEKLRRVALEKRQFGGLDLPLFSHRIERIAVSRHYPGWIEDPRIHLQRPSGVRDGVKGK